MPTAEQFRHAIAAMDAGDVATLNRLIDRDPGLVSDRTGWRDPPCVGYFADPYLLWFIAENPIRNGLLPANIVQVTQSIVDSARRHGAANVQEQLDYALALVASGRIVRECGVQRALIDALVDSGASPDCTDAALAHRERDAVERLIERGATVTLPVAAATGRIDQMQRLLDQACEDQRYKALALAAVNGQATACRILVDNGVDPNRFNPEGCHAHSTPLHQAISANSLATVEVLVTRGADMSIRDRGFNSDALGWASHFGFTQVVAYLREAREYVPAIKAVRAGDVVALQAVLGRQPGLAARRLGNEPRSLLHFATDYPGHRPNVAGVIRLLVECGADVNVRFSGSEHGETPLHWAASCDDVEAIDALLDMGADINAPGGVITGGPPLANAVIFQQRTATRRLLERGAAYELRWAAGAGRLDLVEPMFDHQGRLRSDAPTVPGAPRPQGDEMINISFWLAAQSGELAMLRYLRDKTPDINWVGPERSTPLDRALRFNHALSADWLRSVGGRTAQEVLSADSAVN